MSRRLIASQNHRQYMEKVVLFQETKKAASYGRHTDVPCCSAACVQLHHVVWISEAVVVDDDRPAVWTVDHGVAFLTCWSCQCVNRQQWILNLHAEIQTRRWEQPM